MYVHDSHLWIATDGKSEPFTKSGSNESHAQFSPDGKWIAYASDESKRLEVWMQPYPATGAKFQISLNGGTAPRWRNDGKELYFVSPDQKLMAVSMTLGASPQWGSPNSLLNVVMTSSNQAFWPYTPSANGQKFLVREPSAEDAESHPITVVTNWLAISKTSEPRQ
ncbi:MAG: hypothetical protein ABI811_23975 [Acidobacteriota bacterium]